MSARWSSWAQVRRSLPSPPPSPCDLTSPSLPGGHTAEMLALLGSFDLGTYTPRRYVVADTDRMSGQKAATFEAAAAAAAAEITKQRSSGAPDASTPPYSIYSIPRSREVGQSFLTSVFTTLRAAGRAAAAVLTFAPDVVLTNGPGTAVPVVAAAVAVHIVGVASARVVFVESIARVRRLSLTGRILYHFRLADEFLVQWEELAATYPRAACAGRLM
jgi:beta-1,4-N-acetylglucosaminyltransferase